jgi:hypothetical protein
MLRDIQQKEKKKRKYYKSERVVTLTRKSDRYRRKRQQENRLALGIDGFIRSPAEACETFQVSKHQARYWVKKLVDPSFHAQKPGGDRKVAFFINYYFY